MVAYANGIGGVTVREGCEATPDDAVVQLLPLELYLLDVVLDADSGGFFIFNSDLAFDAAALFVTSDGKSSSVTVPAGLRCNDAVLVPSAVQPMVNRFIAFELLLLVESSLFVLLLGTVCCKDGNADVVILDS